MKTRFNTYDIVCMTAELQRLIGLRVNQIYDIDHKAYLIKFQDKDVKETLLFESGTRFHTTQFEWPKNPSPSGFTMKMRKHLKNKRLENLTQLDTDRIIDLQFGIGEAAYHLILELYDRGNVILCDCDMKILNVLRPHTEGEEIRFVVREKYPGSRGRPNADKANVEILRDVLDNVKSEDTLKRLLTPVLDCGPSVLTHVLMLHNLNDCKVRKKTDDSAQVPEEKPDEPVKGKNAKNKQQKPKEVKATNFFEEKDFDKLVQALDDADTIMQNINRKADDPRGYIVQKTERKPSTANSGETEEFHYNIEYHPILFEQYRDMKCKEFATFDSAVDEFYSSMVSQKIDLKTYQQECEALKKLSNVRRDHEKRLEDLSRAQVLNRHRAELITRNQELINSVLVTMRSAIANQMSWDDIAELVKNAQDTGDLVASRIKQLKLETNHVSLYLTDPYGIYDEEDDEDSDTLAPLVIDIDLGISAYANATKYFDQKRTAAQKEHRTIVSSTKALKNAERKTQEHLKEVRTISNISKARKVFWFEKFYWFISSENYLVIGGRDQQQNELIVKRYLRPSDVYVHADIQGASSIVIRNHYSGAAAEANPIPVKTLNEAGAMAISYSVAWEAKVATSAYWVRAEQVSKTAPTGEYLQTGSFMIRGKKNFLPPCHLILGLSIMFNLEESSISRHANERSVRSFEDSDKKTESGAASLAVESVVLDDAQSDKNDVELEINDDSDDGADPTALQFPDTHIRVPTLSSQLSHMSVGSNISRITEEGANPEEEEEENAIILPVAQQAPRKNRVLSKAKQSGKKNKHAQPAKIEEEEEEKNQNQDVSKQKSGLKRGQRSKLKKIKEKYKDQDEEEKLMRMRILKSAGNKKNEADKKVTDDHEGNEPEKKEKREEKSPQKQQQGKQQQGRQQQQDKQQQQQGKQQQQEVKQQQQPEIQEDSKPNDGEEEEVEVVAADVEVEEEEETPAADGNDVDLLNSLTGLPHELDEMFFALPVVAPYNALQNYKHKVKIAPGTARRGKASKTVLQMFLKDKTLLPQERDLIKAIKPDMAARNMPGKVKISATQSQRK